VAVTVHSEGDRARLVKRRADRLADGRRRRIRISEEAKHSGPEKSVGRDSSEKNCGVCHVSLERNTRPATFHICKQQRMRGAVAKRCACTDPSCTRAKYLRLTRRRPLPEARSDSSAAALGGSDRDTAEGGAFTQTAAAPRNVLRLSWRRSSKQTALGPTSSSADPADGGGEDLREAATGGSRRQAPCASCSTMDKHAYAQMRPVLSRRALQRASTTQPATGRPTRNHSTRGRGPRKLCSLLAAAASGKRVGHRGSKFFSSGRRVGVAARSLPADITSLTMRQPRAKARRRTSGAATIFYRRSTPEWWKYGDRLTIAMFPQRVRCWVLPRD